MSNIYKRIYDNLCYSRKTLSEDWNKYSNLHRHHIIPKHSGGLDEESNYTYLTVREHIIAHFLLWKIHNNPNDLRAMKMLGANLTYTQRKIVGEYCRDNKIGIHGATKNDLARWGNLGVQAQRLAGNKNSFWWWATPEGRKERASLGGKSICNINIDRVWMNKVGASKRISPDKVEKYIADGWNIGVGYIKSEKEISGTKSRANMKVECPHCNKEGQKISMYRWHFDNCKKRTEMVQ